MTGQWPSVAAQGSCGLGNFFFYFLKCILLWLAVFSGVSLAASSHETYFNGTDHALDVYRICGETPGKTLMIIGGIQGDEFSGVLAVDHFVDISLKRGSLILVPRANMPSIMAGRRQVNRDLNRTFGSEHDRVSGKYEEELASVLKALMKESDFLLNLHEGSGFYSPVWISQDRNPLRYGQSLIADAAMFRKKDGTVLDLEAKALDVVERINCDIPDRRNHFHFNNHRTMEEDSLHKEQRNSATFYALTQQEIPAFGVETSKTLPTHMKVQHHIHAIKAFFDILEIVPEFPALSLTPPVLDYLVVSVDGYPPVVVRKNETLELLRGAHLTITDVVANYSRGFSVQIDGFEGKNHLGRGVTLETSVRVRVLKDHQPCGSIALRVREEPQPLPLLAKKSEEEGLAYQLRINDRVFWIPDGTEVDIPCGAVFEIMDVASGSLDPWDLVVNFKGFVANPDNNTGEDRRVPMDTARDLWVRYSEGQRGLVYPVETSLNGRVLGGFKVRLREKDCARPGE